MPVPPRIDLALLGSRLERLRREWDGCKLESDPLLFPHRYKDSADQEVVAFLSSSLAFGRVASIKTSIEAVLAPLGPHPASFLASYPEDRPPVPSGFVHRWVFEEDLGAFLQAIARVLARHGSLGTAFEKGDSGSGDTLAPLTAFLATVRNLVPREEAIALSHGLKFLLPDPAQGGACKRAHLFLRWMVRSSEFDLGLWRSEKLTPSRLLLPMDTHVHRISTYLGLTSRKTAEVQAVREVTSVLRMLNPGDPVSYDWAITRLGILGECVSEITRSHCARCAIEEVCQRSLLEESGESKVNVSSGT